MARRTLLLSLALVALSSLSSADRPIPEVELPCSTTTASGPLGAYHTSQSNNEAKGSSPSSAYLAPSYLAQDQAAEPIPSTSSISPYKYEGLPQQSSSTLATRTCTDPVYSTLITVTTSATPASSTSCAGGVETSTLHSAVPTYIRATTYAVEYGGDAYQNSGRPNHIATSAPSGYAAEETSSVAPSIVEVTPLPSYKEGHKPGYSASSESVPAPAYVVSTPSKQLRTITTTASSSAAGAYSTIVLTKTVIATYAHKETTTTVAPTNGYATAFSVASTTKRKSKTPVTSSQTSDEPKYYQVGPQSYATTVSSSSSSSAEAVASSSVSYYVHLTTTSSTAAYVVSPSTSAAPQYPTTSVAPQYPTTSVAPQYPTTSIAPQYTTTSIAPQYTTTSVAPQYPTTSVAPQYPTTSVAPQYPTTSIAPQYPTTTIAAPGYENGYPIPGVGASDDYPTDPSDDYPTDPSDDYPTEPEEGGIIGSIVGDLLGLLSRAEVSDDAHEPEEHPAVPGYYLASSKAAATTTAPVLPSYAGAPHVGGPQAWTQTLSTSVKPGHLLDLIPTTLPLPSIKP